MTGSCGNESDVCGKEVSPEDEEILIAFRQAGGNRVYGRETGKNNIIDYIGYPKRIYPVGRLDKDSEGLILLTNQGELVNKMMRAGNYHEKEYVVTVNKDITGDFLNQMRNGLYLEELDVHTRPCKVKKVSCANLSDHSDTGIQPPDPEECVKPVATVCESWCVQGS